MKKIVLVFSIGLVLIGAVTAVYASEDRSNTSKVLPTGVISDASKDSTDSTTVEDSTGYEGCHNGEYNSEEFNKMIDVMEENGLQEAATAMKNHDYDSMNKFMNDLTDEQYNQMVDIMEESGFQGMLNMMNSMNREEMVNMHNSMMGR